MQMARKKLDEGEVSKSQSIRELLKANPDQGDGRVAGTGAKGIKVTGGLFYMVKGKALAGRSVATTRERQAVSVVRVRPPESRDALATIIKVKSFATELAGADVRSWWMRERVSFRSARHVVVPGEIAKAIRRIEHSRNTRGSHEGTLVLSQPSKTCWPDAQDALNRPDLLRRKMLQDISFVLDVAFPTNARWVHAVFFIRRRWRSGDRRGMFGRKRYVMRSA